MIIEPNKPHSSHIMSLWHMISQPNKQSLCLNNYLQHKQTPITTLLYIQLLMAAYNPVNFPTDAITKLLAEIPQLLAEKHLLAVETLKSMCRETLALANQGIL